MAPPSSASTSPDVPLHSSPLVNTHSPLFSDATAQDYTRSASHFPRTLHCSAQGYSEQKTSHGYQDGAAASDLSFSAYNDDSDDDYDGGGDGDNDNVSDGDDDDGGVGDDLLSKLYHSYIRDLDNVSSQRDKPRGRSAELPTGKNW